MRYSASDKTEIIRLVEQSPLPARRTLEGPGIPRSSFYRWYDRYQRGGPEGLADQPLTGQIGFGTGSRRLSACQIVDLALDQPDSVRSGTGGALHGQGKILCLRGFGLSASKSARSHHQPGLHRYQSGRGVQGQDHRAQPALADRHQCAAASGVRDGVWSAAIGLQERVANHRKRRWSKAGVVSITEKALQRRQVGDRKANTVNRRTSEKALRRRRNR